MGMFVSDLHHTIAFLDHRTF